MLFGQLLAEEVPADLIELQVVQKQVLLDSAGYGLTQARLQRHQHRIHVRYSVDLRKATHVEETHCCNDTAYELRLLDTTLRTLLNRLAHK